MDIRARGEEIANVFTHGLGALASLGGGAVVITLAAMMGDPWQLISAIVFCLSLLLLYAASTIYHAVRDELIKARLKVVDHCAIFILIAGTYTPFTLVGLRGGWGWTLFSIVWGLAVAGIIFKLFCTGRLKVLSTLMYIGMGWLVLIAIKPMLRELPLMALVWLLIGGLAYTVGTIFYHNKRIPYSHAIWHMFVLGGSTCHFIAVLSQVLPANQVA